MKTMKKDNCSGHLCHLGDVSLYNGGPSECCLDQTHPVEMSSVYVSTISSTPPRHYLLNIRQKQRVLLHLAP